MKELKNKQGKQIDEDKERSLILSKADKIKGEQLIIVPDGVKMEDELKRFALGNVDNPDKKYELLYKGIMKLLKAYLPKGAKNKSARDFIYEEKNTFLTRGHRINSSGIRGADSRMAYIQEHEELLNVITKWIISRGTMIELFTTLRELNRSKGYADPQTGK